jgi:hypothetical protein
MFTKYGLQCALLMQAGTQLPRWECVKKFREYEILYQCT